MNRPRHVLARGSWLAASLAGAGTVALAAPIWRGDTGAWSGPLVAGLYLAGLGLGGVFLTALLELGGARWSASIAAVPRALSALLVPAAPLLLLTFAFAPGLYLWSELGEGGGLRATWLSWPAFMLRSVVYLATWIGCAGWLGAGQSARPGRAAACLLVCGVTIWLAAYDWLVLLTPGWGSTIYGVYLFGGILAGALAAVSLLAAAAPALGSRVPEVGASGLHDLGKLLFGFSTFWMYLWFCQYMLIWYTNLPEETRYFEARLAAGWSVPFWATVVLGWVVPFTLLLSRAGKQSPTVLAIASVSVLAGHWLDLDVMITPAVAPARGMPGVQEVIVAAGVFGLALLVVLRGLRGRRS